MIATWCMVPGIWSAMDRIFCHFGSFFAFYPPNNPKNFFKKMKNTPEDIIILQMCTINDNHMMYGSWDMERDGQFFLSFWTVFVILPPNNLKNQNFEKMKKNPGYIIILQRCTINDNHMMYGSWDIECDRQNFCHFGPFFALLSP